MKRVAIEIPGVPDSALSKSAKGTFWKRREAWNSALEHALLLWRSEVAANRTLDPLPWESASLRITQFWCGQPRDHDNLAASCGAYVDAAVAAGILPDDSPKYIESYELRHEHVSQMSDRKILVEVIANV
jgi:hypothetical protein